MATHTEPAPAPSGPPPRELAAVAGKLIEYEEFIEAQLRKTRSHVWSVDLVGAIMLLVAGTMAFILLAGVVDHWILPGGLGFWGRVLFLCGFLAAASYFLARQVLPLLVRSINPLYAAHTIERSRPSLKNALVNFLMFRANPAGLPDVVYQAIEEQAATNLAKVHVETAVDRSKLIRTGYVLVALVLTAAVYTLLSPKDLIQTAGRVIMPWAEIDAPTRTAIGEIEPGDAQAFRGQQMEVKARIDGLPSDGKVLLTYSSDDGQTVDSAVEMSLTPEGYKHVGPLPAGGASLQQSLTYRIRAGDAVTRPFRIEVVASPTLVVESVEYKYPSYTGLLARRVEHQGDIKAIEGTKITIRALANEPIDAAHVDFDCDQTLDQRMQADQVHAQASFTASLKMDRQTPTHGSYQLIFKNAAGQQNPQPVRHPIEVTRDLPPEIQFVAPKKDEMDLPVNAAVDLEIVANDPDFALRTLKLSASGDRGPVVEKVLLDEAWRGQLVRKFRFEPRKLGLKAGDVVAYTAAAEDNKDPQPNRSETPPRRIRIVSAIDRPANQDKIAKNNQPGDGDPRDDPQPGGEKEPGDDQRSSPADDQPGDPPGQGNPGQDNPQNADRPDDSAPDRGQDEPPGKGQDQPDQGEQGQSGNPQDDQSKDGQSGQAPQGQRGKSGQGESPTRDSGQRDSGAGDAENGVPSDGSNDGDAIERILEHRNQRNPSQGGSAGSNREGQNEKPRPDDQQQQGNREKPQSQPSSKGQQGQKSSGQPNQSESSDSGAKGADRESAQKGDKRQGQPIEPQPGDHDAPRDSTSQAPDSGKGNGKPTDKQPGPNDARQDAEAQGQQEQAGQQVKSSKGSKSGAKNSADKTRQGRKQDGQTPGDDAQPGDEPGADKNRSGESKSGQRSQSKDDSAKKSNEPPSSDREEADAEDSANEKEQGDSGAGQSSKDSKGSPSPQGKHQPRDKASGKSPDQEDQKPSDTPQSPSTSDRESNSEGKQDGDRSGGGKKGGGQKANKPGTGGAGQNTPADEGAGQSDEPGKGEAADRSGNARPSDDKTGQSGSRRGDGSTTAPAGGDKPAGGEGAPPDDGTPAPQSGEPAAGNQPGKQGTGQSGEPVGGQPGQSQGAEKVWKPTADAADKANLEYARKATDLALAHLRDELKKNRPDPELLKRLGWTRQDLENFVKRWEQMRAQAPAAGDKSDATHRELDDALRSLGLRPRATSIKSNSARDDKSQGYKESRRTSPPPEYAEQYKAYTEGTAKGGK